MVAAMWLVAPSILAGMLSLSVGLRRAPWFDELFTTWAVNLDPGSLASFVLTDRDAVHASYYFGLHAYARLVGGDVVLLRLPSALAMAAACLAITLILRESSGMRGALAGGLAFALLPVTWDYGAEARGLALATALMAWATYVLTLQFSRPATAARWFLYTLLVAGAGFLFLWAWLVVVAHIAFVCVPPRTQRTVRNFSYAVGASILVLSPLLLVATGQRDQIAWLTDDRWLWLSQILAFPLAADGIRSILAGIVLFAALLGGSAFVWRTLGRNDLRRRLLVLGWVWTLGPAVLLLFGSFLQPLFAMRYLTVCAPGIALIIGLLLSQMPGRVAMGVMGVGVVAAAFVFLTRDWGLGRDGWRDKERVLRVEARVGDGIYMHAKARDGARLLGLVSRGLVDVGPIRSGVKGTPSPQMSPSWPKTVWLVPLDCPTTQDRAALVGQGYHLLRTYEVGSRDDHLCGVERWTHSTPDGRQVHM